MKVSIGRLRLPEPVGAFVSDAISRVRLTPLRIEHEHAAGFAELPLLHRDPFDRMLVAQARVERVPLLSLDSALARYGVEVVS